MNRFAPIPHVKFALSLLSLAAIAFTLSGCNTPATRRDLYCPAGGEGPHTKRFTYYRVHHEGIYGISQNEFHPRLANEGLIGISNSDARYRPMPMEYRGGIFGISRTVE